MIKSELANIARQLEELGRNMAYEDKVYRAELAERRRLGLHGPAAIRHYNDFMLAHGCEHLIVSEE